MSQRSPGIGSHSDTPALLVARFLRQNGYTATLAAFLDETSLSAADAEADGDTNSDGKSALDPSLTLESLVDAHRKHAASGAFAKAESVPQSRPWRQPTPTLPTLLPSPTPGANMLRVLAAHMEVGDDGRERGSSNPPARQHLVATTAARRVYVFDVAAHPHPALVADWMPADSPVLDWHVLTPRFSLGTCMSGLVFVWANDWAKRVCERRDHRKFLVRAAVCVRNVQHQEEEDASSSDGTTAAVDTGRRNFYVVTAGWDHRIFVYNLSLPSDSSSSSSSSAAAEAPPTLSDPIAQLDLPTLPEDIHLHEAGGRTDRPRACAPRLGRAILLCSARSDGAGIADACPSRRPVGAVPSDLFGRLAHRSPRAGRHDVEHARYAARRGAHAGSRRGRGCGMPTLVRVSQPKTRKNRSSSSSRPRRRSEPDWLLQRKTHARRQSAPRAPRTRLRRPIARRAPVWRPDGSGVWVTGDDGVIRGIETGSVKVVARLGAAAAGGNDDGDGDETRHGTGTALPQESSTQRFVGHEVDSKVRDLWAGWLDIRGSGDREECVLSAGFDRRCILWRME